MSESFNNKQERVPLSKAKRKRMEAELAFLEFRAKRLGNGETRAAIFESFKSVREILSRAGLSFEDTVELEKRIADITNKIENL